MNNLTLKFLFIETKKEKQMRKCESQKKEKQMRKCENAKTTTEQISDFEKKKSKRG